MTWSILGESVTGTSHRAVNVPCQDAFRSRLFGPTGEWLVMAIADGAGSAAQAEAGAVRVCEEVIRLVEARPLQEVFSRDGMVALFREVRNTLIAEAELLHVPLRELACTALLAIIGPTTGTFAQVGDGAIVLGDGLGYRAAFWPEPAEYANATDFLTDYQVADTMRYETMTDPIVELALLTDGLQRLALDFTARVPHPPFFRPLFGAVRDAPDPGSLLGPFRAFLDSARVNERTDDDKTLVLAVRRP